MSALCGMAEGVQGVYAWGLQGMVNSPMHYILPGSEKACIAGAQNLCSQQETDMVVREIGC